MQTAESLRRTIAVTQELQSVVKTMKALAGVNIRQYERAAHAVAEYNRTVEMGLQIALRRLPAQICRAARAPAAKLGAIVFGSDQGMCGQLNDQVVQHAARALEKLASVTANRPWRRWACAPRRQLEGLGRDDRDHGSGAGLGGGNHRRRWKRCSAKIEDWHFQRGIEFVVLFYARPVSGAWYRIRGVRLLPVDEEWINSVRAKPLAGENDPDVHHG